MAKKTRGLAKKVPLRLEFIAKQELTKNVIEILAIV